MSTVEPIADDSNAPKHNVTVARPDPPPLRIHHFLVWITLTAAIISGCMSFDRAARNGPPIRNPVIIAGLVLGAVTIAGALTIVGSGLCWRGRGYTFPQSPGDWLLTTIAASAAGICLAFGVFLAIFFTIGDDDWFFLYYIIAGGLALAGWNWMQFIGMKRYADTAMWRTTFGILLLSPFVVAVGLFLPVVLAVIACILWASCVDWRLHIQRSWTHVCGVAFVVLLGISLLCVLGF